jgi:prolyl-tRNA editing enzyme YbaK/EbsC (Cys-tRNA(Pro) deacylase)
MTAKPTTPAGGQSGPAAAARPVEAGGRSGPAAHPNVLTVRRILDAAGVHGEIRILPDAVATAPAAAAAVGVELGQIANSLVFDADGTPLLVLTSGAHRVDTSKVAALVGAARVRRATPEFVRAATGQPIGGVAPIGHPAPIRTLVDTALSGYDEVWVSGGIPHAVFPTRFDELVRITGGEPAEVA